MDFTGQVALVTGGTRGIGAAIVDGLLSRGATVIVTGTKGRVNIGDKLSYIPLDLSKKPSITKFFQQLKKFEKVDILINNAGINIIEPIDKIKEKNWEKVIQVNLTGCMILSSRLSVLMKKNKKGGKILNVSSIFGLKSRVMRNAYSASKAGLIGLTRSSSLDLAPDNILVNALCPGFTLTDMTRSILSKKEMKELCDSVPIGRMAEVDEVANAALFLCSPLNTYITGQTLTVDGGVMVK